MKIIYKVKMKEYTFLDNLYYGLEIKYKNTKEWMYHTIDLDVLYFNSREDEFAKYGNLHVLKKWDTFYDNKKSLCVLSDRDAEHWYYFIENLLNKGGIKEIVTKQVVSKYKSELLRENVKDQCKDLINSVKVLEKCELEIKLPKKL